MALIRARKEISLNEVKTGHVLEIQYDGDTDLILVVDPEATTVVDTPQGRGGKLHAVKLKQLVETDLVDMISMIRSVSNVNPRLIYDTFKSSPYAEGRRNYRTYTREKIGAIKRISVGQSTNGTNLVRIGGSTLYGVVHGSHVKIAMDDYDSLESQLRYRNYVTFFEGGESHETVTQEVLKLCLSKNKFNEVMSKSKSWEPPDTAVGDAELIGKLVAGWWNQTIADGQGLPNLKNAWRDSGVAFNEPIGKAFKASVGSAHQLILDKFTGYEKKGRYSKQDFIDTLAQRGFDDSENYTEALVDFNEAGHDQVFPEDSNLPPGPIKESEAAFNRARDLHLIELMKTTPGIYFAGDGHLDNLRQMKY